MIPFEYLKERSEATPGLWNVPFSALSASIASMEAGSFLTINPSAISTNGIVNIFANSNVTDYIAFTDTSNIRSDYLLGSHTPSLGDGISLYDVSGATTIVTFSKQSVRFNVPVTGPVFDTGGALADTLNAATFGVPTDSKESRIQAAISAATTAGIHRVYIPASMVSYSAASISFSTAVQMVREGGNWDVCDAIAYGARPDLAFSSTSAIQETMRSAQSQGRVAYIPAGTYLVEGLTFYSSLMMRGGGSGSGLVPVTQLYQPSAATSLLRPLNPAVHTQNFIIEDILLSSFGNTANQGLLDCVNCILFIVRRVSFSGASKFQLRVTGGPTAGDAGFGIIDSCEFQSLQTSGTAVLLQSSANDQPDGIVVSNCYMTGASKMTAFGSIATVGIGADTFTVIGGRLELPNNSSIISGEMSNARFIANRFETTASGGTLGVTLFPASVGHTNPCATFIANAYQTPSGISWIDQGFAKATRWGEIDGLPRHELPDGTQAAPALSFGSETSLGWYRSQASSVSLSYGTLGLPGPNYLACATGDPNFGPMRLMARSPGLGVIGLSVNVNNASSSETIGPAWILEFDVRRTTDNFRIFHKPTSGGLSTINSFESNGQFDAGSGSALFPGLGFISETSLGLYRSAASILALSYGALGMPASGTNPSFGTAVLASGVKVVNTTMVATNDPIFLTSQGGGTFANLGIVEISAISSGQSFTIKSSNVLDDNIVAWWIIKPH